MAKQFAIAGLVHRLDADQLTCELLGMANADIFFEVLPWARGARDHPAFHLGNHITAE